MYVYKLTQYNPEYVWDGEEETTYEEEYTSYLTHEKLYTDEEFNKMVRVAEKQYDYIYSVEKFLKQEYGFEELKIQCEYEL